MQAASPFTTLRGSLAALHHEGPEPSPLAAGGSAPLDLGMAQQMQDLAKQLSMQMEYNSELLAQMQQLEEQQADSRAGKRAATGPDRVPTRGGSSMQLQRKGAGGEGRARLAPPSSGSRAQRETVFTGLLRAPSADLLQKAAKEWRPSNSAAASPMARRSRRSAQRGRRRKREVKGSGASPRS